MGKFQGVLLASDNELPRDHAEDAVSGGGLSIKGVYLLLHLGHGFELLHNVGNALEGFVLVAEH